MRFLKEISVIVIVTLSIGCGVKGPPVPPISDSPDGPDSLITPSPKPQQR